MLSICGLALVAGCRPDPNDRRADLGAHFEWMIDASGTLTPDQVTSSPVRQMFRPATEGPAEARFPRVTYWFLVKIDPDELGLEGGDWMLQLNERFAHFDVYLSEG